MKKLKILGIFTVLIFLTVAIVVIIFLANNTSWLNFNIRKEDIDANNLNPTLEVSVTPMALDLDNLVTKPLIVPESLRTGIFAESRQLLLPQDFQISVFTANLDAPRFFVFDDQNNMFITDKGAGKIVLAKDEDADGVAELNITVDENLRNVHGIDYFEGDLYVAEEHQVLVYRDITPEGSFAAKEVIIKDLPAGGHSTRTVMIGPDRKLYLAVGSSCNVCEEQDERRAAIVRYDLDGSNQQIFARGLRNTVGFVFKPVDSGDFEIWGVDNGRDRIGDNIPVEEVNLIKAGTHYGWPYCHGAQIANPEYPERTAFCENQTEKPSVEMQAHSAPLGLEFFWAADYSDSNFAKGNFDNNLFVAFHGSWNRTTSTGYKVVRIDMNAEMPSDRNFITGWLESDGDAWGRPVDVGFDQNGVMYISDDRAGAIYRVTQIKP